MVQTQLQIQAEAEAALVTITADPFLAATADQVS
jgi:hypothetical protein